MRALSNVLLALVIAVAACRSVPRDVHDAHELSKTESKAALVVAEGLLDKIALKVEDLSDDVVIAEHKKWMASLDTTIKAREVVLQYLIDNEEFDLGDAYVVGLKLLHDMNGGMTMIRLYWKQMISEERTTDAAKFVQLFRKDIARFRELERKFNEWISQFPVKG